MINYLAFEVELTTAEKNQELPDQKILDLPDYRLRDTQEAISPLLSYLLACDKSTVQQVI